MSTKKLSIIYLIHNHEEKWISNFLSSFSNIKENKEIEIIVLFSDYDKSNSYQQKINTLFSNKLKNKISYKIINSQWIGILKLMNHINDISGEYFYIVDGDDSINYSNLLEIINTLKEEKPGTINLTKIFYKDFKNNKFKSIDKNNAFIGLTISKTEYLFSFFKIIKKINQNYDWKNSFNPFLQKETSLNTFLKVWAILRKERVIKIDLPLYNYSINNKDKKFITSDSKINLKNYEEKYNSIFLNKRVFKNKHFNSMKINQNLALYLMEQIENSYIDFSNKKECYAHLVYLVQNKYFYIDNDNYRKYCIIFRKNISKNKQDFFNEINDIWDTYNNLQFFINNISNIIGLRWRTIQLIEAYNYAFNYFSYWKKIAYKINETKINPIITYGTFDLLHYGHRRLIKRIYKINNNNPIVVGVSSDAWNFKKNKKSFDNEIIRIKKIKKLKYVNYAFLEDHEKDGELWDSDCNFFNCSSIYLGSDVENRINKKNIETKIFFLPRTKYISSSLKKKFLIFNKPK